MATKGAAWMMLFSLVSKVLFPIVGIFITGRVGVDAVGVFGIVMTLYTIAELFRDGGLAVTYIAEADSDGGDDSLYHGVAIASGAAFAILIFLSREHLERFFNVHGMAEALSWTAAVILIGSTASIPGSKLVREARFRESGIADVIAAGTGYLVALVLALTGFGLLSLLIQMVVRGVLYVALTIRYAGWVRPRFEPRGAIRLLRRSFANLGTNVAYTVYTMGDYGVISKLLGPGSTGAYFVAYNLAVKPFDLVTGPLSRAMFIAMNRAKGDLPRQSHLLARTISAVALFSIPIYTLTAVHSGAIVSILYPTQFALAGPCLTLLSAYLGVRTLGSPAGSALISSGHAKMNVVAWIPAYLIAGGGIALNFESLDLLTVVFWLSAGAVAVYTTNIILAFRVMGVAREDVLRIGKSIATCFVAVGVIIGARYVPASPEWQFVIALGLGGLVHLAWLGKLRLGSWSRGFSRSGIKALYSGL